MKKLGIGLLMIFVGLQFVPAARTDPPERDQPAAPAEVREILRRACYDCHSNETRWPWYARLAPASFLIGHDVKDGRKELNFSFWDHYETRRKTRKLKELAEQVEKNKMPQWYYVALHPEAKLSADDRELIIKWARQP